jgi:hypothetical protein
MRQDFSYVGRELIKAFKGLIAVEILLIGYTDQNWLQWWAKG